MPAPPLFLRGASAGHLHLHLKKSAQKVKSLQLFHRNLARKRFISHQGADDVDTRLPALCLENERGFIHFFRERLPIFIS